MLKAISFVILYSFFSASMGALVKHLSPTVPTEVITFWQFLFAWLTALPLVWKAGGIRTLRAKKWSFVWIRSILGVIAYYCFYTSIKQISLVDSVLLNNTSPLFIPIVAYIWFRTKMPTKLWLGIIVGFIGIIVILRPSANIVQLGALLALSSGILNAVVMLAIRCSDEFDPPHILLFFYTLSGTVLFLPWAIQNGVSFPPHVWVALIGVGVCMFLVQLSISESYEYATPIQVAPFTYTSIVFAALLSWLFWQNIPDLWTFSGTVLVVCGAVTTIMMQKTETN